MRVVDHATVVRVLSSISCRLLRFVHKGIHQVVWTMIALSMRYMQWGSDGSFLRLDPLLVVACHVFGECPVDPVLTVLQATLTLWAL